MPKGYFDREVKLKTPDQMFAKLAERTSKLTSGGSEEPITVTGRTVDPNVLDTPKPSSTPAAISGRPNAGAEVGGIHSQSLGVTAGETALAWDDPVKNPDGTGYQLSVGGVYSVTRVKTNGEWRYEAWRRLPLPVMLAIRNAAPEARQACQDDR